MAKGFIYVVTTATSCYEQKDRFNNVPYYSGERLLFGPCKKFMRPRMTVGDYVFGVSPSGNRCLKTGRNLPRRILFVGRIKERMSFGEAYDRFPELRTSFDEHSPAKNEEQWFAREYCFVFCARNGWLGKWLGREGPEVDGKILEFFNTCEVHRSGARPLGTNHGTKENPIAAPPTCPPRYIGIHLETDKPEALVNMCGASMPSHDVCR